MGAVPSEYANNEDPNYPYFTGESGSRYYYNISVTDDGIGISDTVGRFVPIDGDNVRALAVLLPTLVTLIDEINNQADIYNDIVESYLEEFEASLKDYNAS